jgi:hypothetical protein|tara:strand:+ start:331 stop:918 length:588 start_codon:yes stop_codon:yes gene_type:complete
MCNPIAAAITLGSLKAGASIFAGATNNKNANALAEAQAEAAKNKFFEDRARTELNYQMDLEAIEEQEQIADFKQAVEEDNILIAIGDKLPAGQSTSKIFTNTLASGALNMATLQGNRENLRRQNVYAFKDSQSQYEGKLEEIKGNLNQNFLGAGEMAMGAGGAFLSGASQGLSIGKSLGKATAPASSGTTTGGTA